MQLPLHHVDFIDNASVGPNDAFFPQDTPVDRSSVSSSLRVYVHTKYMRLVSETGYAILKVSKKNIGEGIAVSKSTLQATKDLSLVEYTDSTRLTYYCYRIKTDRSLQTAFGSLLILLVVLGIDAALLIGRQRVLIPCTPDTLVVLSAFSFLLKMIGAGLAFYKVLLDDK